jgi:YjbR protein
MTDRDFRRIALALAGAVEGEHMAHPDFRVQSRIFATIHPDPRRGSLMLTPEQQARFLEQDPQAFSPAAGAWGRSGSTYVLFEAADEELVGEGLTLAWQNAVAKGPTKSRSQRTNAKAPKRNGANGRRPRKL